VLRGSRLGYCVHVANLYNKLIEDAKRVGRHKTKKEAVTAALAEYVARRSGWIFCLRSARSISIPNTITKPSGAGRDRTSRFPDEAPVWLD